MAQQTTIPVQIFLSPLVVLLSFISRFALVRWQIDSKTTASEEKNWSSIRTVGWHRGYFCIYLLLADSQFQYFSWAEKRTTVVVIGNCFSLDDVCSTSTFHCF